ncbi:HK97 gp10 family phage protein [Methylobacterium sp. ID0610]|uniref:HK97 gp10 family phage protein n=1 Tax=Methylobacterium carpenticola TaxID=3344827 RepID=UPI0036A2C19C
MGDFLSQITEWCRQTEARAEAVFRESAQRVIGEMQGRVPVDTGFLKSSLQVSTTAPVPADRSPAAGTAYPYNPTAATVAIAGAQIGDRLFASYSAVYAPRINYGFVGTDALGRTYNQSGRHFVELAVQRWPAIVNDVCRELQSRATGTP